MDVHILLITLYLQYGQGYSKTCSVDPTSNRVKNAALNKPATQISTYQTGAASKAVDGDTNPRYSVGSCMHTHWREGLPLYQWWMVDLAREYRIDSVNITNRLNNAERQRDFDIFVSLNSTFEDDDHMTDERLCTHVSGKMGKRETRTFICQTSIFGQFIQIYMETLDKRNMNICEVTVEGYPAICIDTITTTTSYTTTSASTTTPTETATVLSATTPTTTRTTLVSTIPTTSETTRGATIWETATMKSTAATTTTTSSMITTALLLSGNNTTTATPTCPCVCGISSNTTNLTQEAQVELVKKLAKELTVNKKETSISKRKLVSVGDERQSAKTIGRIAVLALCVPILLIVSFDLINLWSFAKQGKKSVTSK